MLVMAERQPLDPENAALLVAQMAGALKVLCAVRDRHPYEYLRLLEDAIELSGVEPYLTALGRHAVIELMAELRHERPEPPPRPLLRRVK